MQRAGRGTGEVPGILRCSQGKLMGRSGFLMDYWKDNTDPSTGHRKPPWEEWSRMDCHRLKTGKQQGKKKRKDRERREKVRNYSAFHH